MKFLSFSSMIILLVFGVYGCRQETQDIPGKPLVDTHWLFSSVEGDTSGISDISPRPYLLIRPGEKGLRFQVFAGCNNMLGQLETDSISTLRFSRIASTRKMCPKMDLEDRLSTLLPEVNGFEINGTSLSLFRDKDLIAELDAGSHQRH